jgi:hypothetical protein
VLDESSRPDGLDPSAAAESKPGASGRILVEAVADAEDACANAKLEPMKMIDPARIRRFK